MPFVEVGGHTYIRIHGGELTAMCVWHLRFPTFLDVTGFKLIRKSLHKFGIMCDSNVVRQAVSWDVFILSYMMGFSYRSYKKAKKNYDQQSSF